MTIHGPYRHVLQMADLFFRWSYWHGAWRHNHHTVGEKKFLGLLGMQWRQDKWLLQFARQVDHMISAVERLGEKSIHHPSTLWDIVPTRGLEGLWYAQNYLSKMNWLYHPNWPASPQSKTIRGGTIDPIIFFEVFQHSFGRSKLEPIVWAHGGTNQCDIHLGFMKFTLSSTKIQPYPWMSTTMIFNCDFPTTISQYERKIAALRRCKLPWATNAKCAALASSFLHWSG